MQTVPFEIHLTTADLPKYQIASFAEACRRLGGKALLIELSRGDCTRQPMFSRVVYAREPVEAIHGASGYVGLLLAGGFRTTRVKLEVPFACAATFGAYRTAGFEPYFEWHGKVPFQRVSQLLEVCLAHRVHLSLNVLNGETATRFVTLREFGTAEIFQRRIDALTGALEKGGWPIAKPQSEYCLYDTNTALDRGWLSQPSFP